MVGVEAAFLIPAPGGWDAPSSEQGAERGWGLREKGCRPGGLRGDPDAPPPLPPGAQFVVFPQLHGDVMDR